MGKSNDGPRAAIRKLISDNAGTITANLSSMLHRNVQDMIDAGIDRREVVEAAFSVGVTHQAALLGIGATSALLRDVADYLERIAIENSQDERRH